MTQAGAPELPRPDAGPGASSRRPWEIPLLLVLAGWLVSVHLAHVGLVDPDEPRTALIARLMVERGDWLSPHLPALFHHHYLHYPLEGDTFAYWDKPPLYFWLAALAMKALGPTALAARLPSALSHVGCVLVAYAAARWLWDRRAGLLAGAVLAAAPLALVMAHVARMEALLAFLMTAMLLAILRLLGDRPKSWAWTLVLYVAAGLGLLTKGPVAVVLPAAAVLVTLLVCGRLRDLGRLRPLAGLVIMLLVAAPWYVYMHVRYPPGTGGTHGFSEAFFIAQNLQRATTEAFGHSRHVPGYLLGILLVGFAPWTIFLPALCLRLFRLARHRTREWRSVLFALRAGARERTGIVLCLVWAATIVAAFSASKTQLAHYVTPAVPPLAILMGAYLAERTRPEAHDRLFAAGLWLTSIVGAGCMAAMVAALEWEELWRPHYLGLIAVIAAIMVAGVVALRRRRTAACVALIVTGMAAVMTFAFSADPFDIYASYSTRIESRTLLKMLRPGDAVLAFPRTPYSMAWHLWPREVRYPTVTGDLDGEPSVPALVAELNKPRRTFCMLQKKKLVDVLRTEVRWPVQVLSRKPNHTLILTEPPAAEETPHEP